MNRVTIRDLRNHGGEILRRVSDGEALTVTRDGEPVAELRPLARRPLTAAVLVRRWRPLAKVDPEIMRAEIDANLDGRL